MMGSEMYTAVQRERFQLQGVPVGSVLRRPGASGDRSRTQRSVNAPKAAGDKHFILCNLGGTTEYDLQTVFVPFLG